MAGAMKPKTGSRMVSNQGKYKNINHLEYDDAIDAGQSFWRFIGKMYGDALIPNIIYLTKIYKNIDDGFLYVMGQDLKDILKEWRKYYSGRVFR